MIVDGSKIGFTRSWRGIPAKTQQVHNERAGAQTHRDAKEDRVDAIDIANMAPQPPVKGKHDTIFVYLLRLAVGKSIKGKPSPTAQFHSFLNAVREGRTVIVESATGRRSDKRRDFEAMIDWALKCIRHGSANLPPGFSTAGRNRKVFTQAELTAGKAVWKSDDYATDVIAAKHLPPGMSIYDARALFKSSGRKPGRKPEQKRKR